MSNWTAFCVPGRRKAQFCARLRTHEYCDWPIHYENRTRADGETIKRWPLQQLLRDDVANQWSTEDGGAQNK